MEIREKIRKIYQKNGVQVDNDYIEYKMKDKEKEKQFMRLYKQEEIESMNYIFGKDKDNKYFTEFELKAVQGIDLFDGNVINICKIIWANKNDKEKLQKFLKTINMEVNI